WYQHDIVYQNDNDNKEIFNWIDLLSPALHQFFDQSEKDIRDKINNERGYIMCIDSLTIKFEGIIQHLSNYIGAQTIEVKEDGTEARISFDKLLDNEKFKALYPDDDIALLKFLFTSEGLNLRNNIAHSFY